MFCKNTRATKQMASLRGIPLSVWKKKTNRVLRKLDSLLISTKRIELTHGFTNPLVDIAHRFPIAVPPYTLYIISIRIPSESANFA